MKLSSKPPPGAPPLSSIFEPVSLTPVKCGDCGAQITESACAYCGGVRPADKKPQARKIVRSDMGHFRRLENVELRGDMNRIGTAVNCLIRGDMNQVKYAIDTEAIGDMNQLGGKQGGR